MPNLARTLGEQVRIDRQQKRLKQKDFVSKLNACGPATRPTRPNGEVMTAYASWVAKLENNKLKRPLSHDVCDWLAAVLDVDPAFYRKLAANADHFNTSGKGKPSSGRRLEKMVLAASPSTLFVINEVPDSSVLDRNEAFFALLLSAILSKGANLQIIANEQRVEEVGVPKTLRAVVKMLAVMSTLPTEMLTGDLPIEPVLEEVTKATTRVFHLMDRGGIAAGTQFKADREGRATIAVSDRVEKLIAQRLTIFCSSEDGSSQDRYCPFTLCVARPLRGDDNGRLAACWLAEDGESISDPTPTNADEYVRACLDRKGTRPIGLTRKRLSDRAERAGIHLVFGKTGAMPSVA